MSETRRRRSRVLEYFESRQAEPEEQEEQQPEDEGADPFADLDQSFGILQSGKESPSGE